MARRVHPQGGQRERDALRARHPHVRDRLPLHARPDGRPGAQGAHAPAGRRRPEPRRRAGATWCCRSRWPRRRRARTASSSRCTRTRRRPICDGPQQLSQRRRSPTYVEKVERVGRGRRQGPERGGRVKVAVVGVGLIGGSVGLAARERLGAHVSGCDPDAAARARRSSAARHRGAASSMAEAVEGADVVFVAAPVESWRRWSREALRCAGPDCVVTDVGSTKRAVVERGRATSASSAATRWRAPRPPASSTPAPTCSTAPRGT